MIDSQIREILKEHARLAIDLAALDDAADLYQAGMTSHASVNVMLALEGNFDVAGAERADGSLIETWTLYLTIRHCENHR
ncbi:MAG: hypothetical protein NTZ90_17280 [Proteobacteria bacterium]|nr:hypothetical protein [Pseudomonadota bacterium]